MSRIIVIFLSMIQSLDLPWRVFVTCLVAIASIWLSLFVFFPLILSILQMVLRFLQKGILMVTTFCMRTWGRLVIFWRQKAGKFPQFLVSIEDFFIAIITFILSAFRRLIQWKPSYGAISKRLIVVSMIMILLLGLALWVLPGSDQVLKTLYNDWEKEYVDSNTLPASAIMTTLDPQKNGSSQIYYTLAVESANLRHTPDGEIVTQISNPSTLIRFLGEKKEQWLNVEIFDKNQLISGWVHESVVSLWKTSRKSLLYLEPEKNIRISAPGVPMFTCRFVGLKQAEDETVTVILETE